MGGQGFGGELTGPKRDNSMNDGGVNYRRWRWGTSPPVLLVTTTSACYLCCVFPSSDWFCNRCVCVCVSDGDTLSQATSQAD